MSGTVAAVNIVRPDDRTGKLLRKKIQLVGSFRAAEYSEVLWPMFFNSCPKTLGGAIQCLFPGCRTQTAVFTNQRLSQTGFATFHHLLLQPVLELRKPLLWMIP